ncbi:MAG: hypothetical protein ABW039_02835 [Sphingobium sp.]
MARIFVSIPLVCAMAAGGLNVQASAQTVVPDPYTASNQPGRSYVRLLAGASGGGYLNVPLDASITIELDNFRLRDILARYGISRANGLGESGLAFTNTNVLGTQVLARYRQTAIGAASLEVILPCASSGRSDTLGASVRAQGLPYAGAPADAPATVVENVEASYASPYSVRFDAASPSDAERQYRDFLSANSTTGAWQYGGEAFSSSQLLARIQSCSVATSNSNPLIGSPEGLQFQMVEAALDSGMQMIDSDMGPRREVEDEPWGVGARIGVVDRGGVTGTQFDAKINRVFRVFEGGRSLLSIDVPISYLNIKGADQFRAAASVALRMPVSSIWGIEPRISYGMVTAQQAGLKGQMVTGTVTSLLFLNNLLGRGAITIGNMVGYSKAVRVELYGQKIDSGQGNVVLRNALAYELPIKRRASRQMSLRGSYSMTNFLGADIYANTYHEISTSLGVRSRTANIRNAFEVFRIGIATKFGRDYKAAHLFVGYRF